MILRLIHAEILKLREPVTLLALLGPPGLVGALLFLGVMRAPRALTWMDVMPPMQQVWAPILFPLAATAITAFAAQIEHRARGWDHMLALPARKWQIFAAKAVVTCVAVLALYPLMILFLLAGGWLGGQLGPHGAPTGPTGLGQAAWPLTAAAGSGLAMIAIQLWIALRFQQFMVPVVIGVGATMVTMISLVFNRADDTRFWPWAMPFRVVVDALQRGPDSAMAIQVSFAVGVAGGLAVLGAMMVDLSRREMRK